MEQPADAVHQHHRILFGHLQPLVQASSQRIQHLRCQLPRAFIRRGDAGVDQCQQFGAGTLVMRQSIQARLDAQQVGDELPEVIEIGEFLVAEIDTDLLQGVQRNVGEIQPGAGHIDLVDRHPQRCDRPALLQQAAANPRVQQAHLQAVHVTGSADCQSTGAGYLVVPHRGFQQPAIGALVEVAGSHQHPGDSRRAVGMRQGAGAEGNGQPFQADRQIGIHTLANALGIHPGRHAFRLLQPLAQGWRWPVEAGQAANDPPGGGAVHLRIRALLDDQRIGQRIAA
ncbi:hypothetical protein D9M71_300010 [compost metagenome]